VVEGLQKVREGTVVTTTNYVAAAARQPLAPQSAK